mmetsp:Transcript_13423/g.19203  ORF Transcript_13423/g.19203 Transcript_13423/m.19203 type:complete len:85 (+) Transcript_13423:1774-2028(+)
MMCSIPPALWTDDCTGLKTATITTRMQSKITLIVDVLDKFAISLCIERGSIMHMLESERIALAMDTLVGATPNNLGSDDLMIMR